MPQLKTILCIEDNSDSCDLISFVFQNIGFEVTTCATSEEGIQLARTKKFAAIIMDLWLEGIDGIDICRAIRTFDSETPIIFYTADARAHKKQAGLEAGAQAFLIKPEGFEYLEETVLGLINQSERNKPQEIEKSANFSFLSSKTFHPFSNN